MAVKVPSNYGEVYMRNERCGTIFSIALKCGHPKTIQDVTIWSVLEYAVSQATDIPLGRLVSFSRTSRKVQRSLTNAHGSRDLLLK